ncbi:MAG: acyl-CoA dehydrogenase, partial [Pseudomonadota bacterium]
WISWGDNDFAENVVHLVLARLPDAPAGSRGISLFLVPKFVPDAGGAPGRRNELQVVSLDHKVGLHGSPTCVMAYEGATGWMIGEPNKGLACMFTMMNNARLGVSTEGIGVAEAAFQHALAFARDREQGRTPPIAEGERSILGHADVRRMLTAMKAQTQAARALAYDCALHLDLARAAPSESARAEAAAMGAFLTPIAKAFGTDTGNEVAHMGVEVHGGSGCIEETGAAQFSRDVRVTAIYEGTNGIQAMDLVGRKLADGGATARAFLARVEETAAALATAAELPRDPDGLGALGLQTFGAQLREAAEVARAATDWMLAAESHDRGAGAAAYLRMLALIAGGRYHGRAALSSGERRRRELARFWGEHFLPEAGALAQKATRGAKVLYALSADDLAAA